MGRTKILSSLQNVVLIWTKPNETQSIRILAVPVKQKSYKKEDE